MTWLGQNWIELLGWSGSALLILSLLQTRVLLFRWLNLVASLALVLFNSLIEVWPMVAMNAVLSAINAWFIVKLLAHQHDEHEYEVVEVSPSDEYLRHVLRVHGADILRFQPDFVWDPGLPDQHAFLVLRGNETVGMVLLAAEGPVARVRLDYVTPRFRDFSPGEFVWRRSGVLRDLGFRRVLTPPGMVEAYYGRLGFHREGDAYALEL